MRFVAGLQNIGWPKAEGEVVTFTVRPATPSDAPAICGLFTRVFGREMTPAEWKWKYADNPDGWAAVVAESGGQTVGHFGGWPFRALIAGREATVTSLVDVATIPEARALGGRRPVLVEMAEALFEILRPTGTPFGFGFPSPRHLTIGERLIGYREHFPVREIRFELSQAPGATERSGIDLTPRPPLHVERGWPEAGGEVGSEGPAALERLDPLWNACRPLLAAGCLVRDRAHAVWRYARRPDRAYRLLTLGEDAWAAWSLLGEQAIAVDYLVRPPVEENLARLARALEGEAAAAGARRLVFWEPPGGPYRGPLQALAGAAGARASNAEAGFSFVTAKIFDEEILRDFLHDLHFTAGFYDDR